MADDFGGAFGQAGKRLPDVFRPIQAEHMIGGFQMGSPERVGINFPQPIQDQINLGVVLDKAFFAEADEGYVVFPGQARGDFEIGGKKVDMMMGVDAVRIPSEKGIEFFQLFSPL